MHYFCPVAKQIFHRAGAYIATVGLASLLSSAAVAQSNVVNSESAEAMRKQGVTLVYSSNVETAETREGLRLLEIAAGAGDSDAMITLGGIYLYGTILPPDWPRALGYFEAAAESGDGSGLYRYGVMLMWSERDAAMAEETLVRAGEMGATKAWVALAEGAMYGYLGGGHISRSKFDGYAERATAEGEKKVPVLDAIRHTWGISVTASGPKALAILKEAADDGNSVAAAYLIKLVRSGNRWNVRRDRARAREYLEAYRSVLSDEEAWQLEVTIRASEARSTSDLAEVADLMFSRPEMVTKEFGADLLKANPNAAIYALQLQLTKRGYEVGTADGFAGRRTLRAMNEACRILAPRTSCDDSVMRPDVISTLIVKL